MLQEILWLYLMLEQCWNNVGTTLYQSCPNVARNIMAVFEGIATTLCHGLEIYGSCNVG